MRISDSFPDLSKELKTLLEQDGESGLAEQVSTLKLINRCQCGDDFCATIYTEPEPLNSYPPRLRTVPLDPERGMIILDVVDDRIVCVEILHRDEIRRKLLELLP